MHTIGMATAAPAVVTGEGWWGGGVRRSGRHDDSRVADRRLSYHP